jgi:hypothetical protein
LQVLNVETTRMSTNWPYRCLADLTSQELLHRAAEYRQMAITARGQDTVRALNTLAVRFALLAARREIEEGVFSNGAED